MTRSRRTLAVQAVLAVVVAGSAAGLMTAPSAAGEAFNHETVSADVGERVAPPASGTTVIATQGHDKHGFASVLVAIDERGRLTYREDQFSAYWDVDPHPTGRSDVLSIASEPVGERTRMVIRVVNLSTGDSERLYSTITPYIDHSRWHDVDQINETHYVVAGIERDRVLVINVKTNETVWQWYANESFAPSSGGPPNDWTHLNDVEVLPDGRIMASLRNHDQVVAIRPNGTLDEDWTLGSDGATSTLYEQHNPDYIPAEQGGPALIVADSENDRVVEYQREAGEWRESWHWRDKQLNWPRDADRLPNSHTLVTDSAGDRILEVDREGRVVWSAAIGYPYEAERLGTGDESDGGPSAARAEIRTRDHRDVLGMLPRKPMHALAWVTPARITAAQVVWTGVFAIALGLLVGVEVLVRTDGGDSTGERSEVTDNVT